MRHGVEVVGLMRFSVVLATSTASHWKNTKGRSLDDITRAILDPGRLEARLRLAERMPFASLARQTDPDFRLAVLVSTLLPTPFRSRLAELAGVRPFLQVVEVGVEDGVGAVCARLIPPDAPAITFRLDDDDAVGPHHVADLRAMAVPANEEKVLASPHGLYMERRGERLAFQRVEYVKNAFGIGCYSRTGRTIFHQGNHAALPDGRIAVNPRADAWIRSIHAGSDSDTRFQSGRRGWSVRPDEAGARLPDYRDIDFAAVARDLAPFPAGRAFDLGLGRLLKRRARQVKMALVG